MVDPPRNKGLLSVTVEVAGSNPAVRVVESFIYGRLSLELIGCMPDNPIGIAYRRKHIVWGILIRADVEGTYLYRLCLETGTSGTLCMRFCISARAMETIFDKASSKAVGLVFCSI